MAATAAAIAAAPPAGSASVPPAVETAARAFITQGALEAPIRFLASDLLEGRGPASRGDELARLYLQTQLQGMGYQPAFPNGAWQQPFDIVGIKSQFPKTWSFTGKGGPVSLTWHDDYVAFSGQQKEQVSVANAELVFVGYGIQAPEYQWDDYKGANLAGKILVMMNNDPDWDPNLFAGKRRLYYGRWDYKYESATRQKAAGAIIIHTTPSAGYPFQVVQSSWGGEQFELPAGSEARMSVRAWATEEAVRRLLKSAGFDLDKLIESAHSRDFKPVALGVTTSLAFTNTISRVKTANVGGVLPGNDRSSPRRCSSTAPTTITSASASRTRRAIKIYHGANDNASGCAQVLAIARAFARCRSARAARSWRCSSPARSAGLLGSPILRAAPLGAPGRIAADINIDGSNIFGKSRDVVLVSHGQVLAGPDGQRRRPFAGTHARGDQYPDRGYYYRSDQFSFAKIGVPALYFKEGADVIGRPAGWGKQQHDEWELKKYHQPSDKLEAAGISMA